MTIAVINPATEETICTLASDSPETIRAKFKHAQEAQRVWRQTPLAARQEAITKFAGLLETNLAECARITSAEMGKPVHQAEGEIKASFARIAYFQKHVETLLADEIKHRDGTMTERLSWEPLGTIANISAWNFPYFVGLNVLIPALLTGNAVLYKPSEVSPLTGKKLAELFWLAGIPQDVLSLIMGSGFAGATLIEQNIDGVFFTGSYNTGKSIAQQTAPRMLKLGLELGGKDPAYICSDVDIAKTAEAVADGAFYNAGQSCCAVERIYVEASIYKPFVEAVAAFAKKLQVGEPTDPKTYMGPLARQSQLMFLQHQVGDAVAKGATLCAQGEIPQGRGWYFAPTVLSDCHHEMRIMREESFGPVIGIQSVANDAEALRLMADTEYGLTASVHTQDLARAENLLRELAVGTAYVNACDRVSPYLPWSGCKHSGVGSTLSELGIRTFLRPKAWHIRS